MAFLILSPGIPSIVAPSRLIPNTRTRNAKLSVCWGVKHLEREALTSNPNSDFEDAVTWCLYGQVKQQSETEMAPLPAIKTEDEEGRKQDYYVNTGYAIRTLREEFPELFYRELNFDIYRDDIVFRDPLNTFFGIKNYKMIFWALRFYGRILFKALWVDIVSVWQPTENMIIVRWTVQGIPRIPWESCGRFDGTSEYKLDKTGKIYEHKVHNIALNGPQKFQVLAVDQLIQSLGCPSTPKPTYFEISFSSMASSQPLKKLSAVKRHLVSMLTKTLKSKAES